MYVYICMCTCIYIYIDVSEMVIFVLMFLLMVACIAARMFKCANVHTCCCLHVDVCGAFLSMFVLY